MSVCVKCLAMSYHCFVFCYKEKKCALDETQYNNFGKKKTSSIYRLCGYLSLYSSCVLTFNVARGKHTLFRKVKKKDSTLHSLWMVSIAPTLYNGPMQAASACGEIQSLTGPMSLVTVAKLWLEEGF